MGGSGRAGPSAVLSGRWAVTQGAGAGPLQQVVEQRLASAFAPAHLEVRNESHLHDVPPGAESHFKVVVVSERFAAQPLVARHRAIHRALDHQLASGIHALTITAVTPAEWEERDGGVAASPPCRGGD